MSDRLGNFLMLKTIYDIAKAHRFKPMVDGFTFSSPKNTVFVRRFGKAAPTQCYMVNYPFGVKFAREYSRSHKSTRKLLVHVQDLALEYGILPRQVIVDFIEPSSIEKIEDIFG